MDDMITRQVDWKRLDDLVPDEFDKYWEVTLNFLKFMREHWPAILQEKSRIEPAERRDRLIAVATAQIAKSSGPVIAAGSTGSIPATATLLATIAQLPHGAVVLPGLDTDIDDETWATLSDDTEAGHGHPQFAMAALLRRIGILRSNVEPLVPPAAHGRERIVSEALRPAAASDLWRDRLSDPGFVKHA
jgi:ATP-dependent helicase/nuclease subunit B